MLLRTRRCRGSNLTSPLFLIAKIPSVTAAEITVLQSCQPIGLNRPVTYPCKLHPTTMRLHAGHHGCWEWFKSDHGATSPSRSGSQSRVSERAAACTAPRPRASSNKAITQEDCSCLGNRQICLPSKHGNRLVGSQRHVSGRYPGHSTRSGFVSRPRQWPPAHLDVMSNVLFVSV